MGKGNVLLQSFRGGVISPLMSVNAEMEKFRHALTEGTNYLILPDGSALMRPGSQYLMDVNDSTAARLVTFEWDTDFLVELGDQYARVISSDGTVEATLVTPFLEAQLSEVKYAQKYNKMVFTHPEHAPQELYYNTSTGAFVWRIFLLSNVPEYDFNDDDSPIPTDTINDLTFTGFAAGEQYQLSYGGQRTEAIVWSALGVENENRISNALEALPSIGALTTVTAADQTGNVYRVTVSGPDAGKGAVIGTAFDDGNTIATTVIDAGGSQSEKVWSVTRGWPVSCTFFEQRLIFGASKSLPQGFWGSKVAAYNDFGVGIFDSDAYFFELDHREPVRIFWSETGDGYILFGTSHGLWTATGIDGPLTSTSFFVRRQSSTKCAAVQGKNTASESLFIEKGNHKLRNLVFSDERKVRIAFDLSFMVSHLAEDDLKEPQMFEFPEKLILIPKASGTVLVCAYDIASDLLAWTPFTTDGTIVDTSVWSEFGTSQSEVIAMIVERNGQKFIELIDLSIYTTSPEQEAAGLYGWTDLPYLDSHVRYQGAETLVISGLDHLEGRTVSVIVNGAVHPDKTVAGGEITLDFAGTDVIVGLKYENMLTTTQQAYGNPRGTALGTKRRWNRVFLNLVSSVRPEVNDQAVADRTPSTPMDTPEPMVTEETEYRVTEWNDGKLSIVNPYALACCVSGVFGEFSVESQ